MRVRALFLVHELVTDFARVLLDVSDSILAAIDRLQRGESKEST